MYDNKASVGQVTALGHHREHLDSARMAEFVFRPDTVEAKSLAASLSELTLKEEARIQSRKRKRQQTALKDFQGAVAAFAADLIHHSQFTEAAGFLYRSSDRDLLSQTLVSSRFFDQLIKFWVAMGWMEKTSFFRAKGTWEGDETGVFLGRTTRYRATPVLLQIADEFGINGDNIPDHFIKELGRISPVTVRSEEVNQGGRGKISKNIKQKGPRFDEEVQRVVAINAVLAEGGFDLTEIPRLYRLFNRGNHRDFDFNMGGRLYCRSEDNWQQMPKAQRSRITWKGEPTVELDVRASHLFILYALNGTKLSTDGDPYLLPDVERHVVKGLFAAITGKGSVPQRWPKSVAEKHLEKTGRRVSNDYKLKEVMNALLDKHPILERISEGKLDWAKLQYEESECFMNCLTRLGQEHEVAVLPVHDSLIVAKRHIEVAYSMLGESYKQRLGFTPLIIYK